MTLSKPALHAVTALPLALALLMTACTPPAEKEEKAEPAVPVAVAKATRGTINAAYRGTATIEADAEATVAAKIGGIVERIMVEEGDPVSAGDTLAQLEQERLRLEVDRARADFHRLESVHERNQRVVGQKLVSREDYERSRYEMQAAKAALDLADLSLRESTIRAPIGGVIAGRHIKVGNTVQVNAPLFDITRMDSLEAHLHVPEREIHKLAPRQNAQVRVDAWPEQVFAAEVARINPIVDASSGTVKVTLALNNAEGKLRPGMFGRIEVEYDQRSDALLIPKDAVLIEDATASVFVVADGKALRKAITLGYDDARHYEVREGLLEGDAVVTTGRASLKDGAAADIVETAP